MIRVLEIFFNCIDWVTEKIGNIVCFFIILIMFVVATSTVSRYFFNEPVTVIWPFIRQLFGIIVLLGAAYTLLYDRHIRVDILYDHFPAWMRGVVRGITLICFLAFLGVLTWQGVLMAKISFMLKETTSHVSRLPIYPFKILLPIASFFFLIQGIVFYLGKRK
jgi:TRAP-type mannitol/chloroaromatic compound transport system permease small subunit